MGRGSRATFVALVATLFLLVGCASVPTVEVSDWQLTSELVAAKPVHLPAHITGDLPTDGSTYTLRARVALPDAMRGRALTFELPVLHARTTVLVGGEELTPLDPRMREGYRGIDQQAYRIPAALTDAGTLDVQIVVPYVHLLGSRIDVPPRIAASEEGDPVFRFVRAFNQDTAEASAVVVLFTAFAYGLVFLRDRRRVAYGWFALEACGASYTLLQHGVLQHLVGRYEQSLVGPLICIGELASVHFTHVLFKLGKPHPAWTWATVACFAVAALVPSPFLAPFWVILFSDSMTLVNVNYQALQMVRIWRRDGPSFQVAAIFLSWVVLAVLGLPDIVMWFGLGEIAGGLRGVSLGLTVIATLQVIVLSREHHDALVRAELLNDELKRQIASRADTLAAALTRASTLAAAGHVLEVGQRLEGRYEVVRRLGEGAAGIVYEVKRLSDGARLALKLLRAAADTTDMARFAREAQLIAKLDHPNVVRIVDVDVNATGFFYIVVELVEGRSLGDHRKRFGDARWGLSVLGQMAHGLAAVHAQGIIHRDLKPGNVLVSEGGAGGEPAVRIADFGIAGHVGLREVSILERESVSSKDAVTLSPSDLTPTTGDMPLTQTGAWIGTPRYMAPELVDGAKKADWSSDVFAFGLIAHEVLTGKLPYEGSAALLELKGERYEPPASIRARCPSLDPAIADAIDACLAIDPASRPRARSLAETLRRHASAAA